MVTGLLSLQTLLILVGVVVLIPLVMMLLRSGGSSSSADMLLMHNVAERLAHLEQSHSLYMASLNRPIYAEASSLRFDDWLQYKRGLLESKAALAHAYHMILELEKSIDRMQPSVPEMPPSSNNAAKEPQQQQQQQPSPSNTVPPSAPSPTPAPPASSTPSLQSEELVL